MNCRYYQELLTDLLAGELTPAQQQQLERHLAECPACAAECRSAREALDAVTPHIDTALPAGFESRLLEAVRRAAPAPERLASQRRRRRLIRSAAGIFSAAALLAVALMTGLNTPVRAARSCFRQAIVSMSGLKSLDMELQVRTRVGDNFGYIDPDLDFVPHTLRVVFTPGLMWRIEKPGRTAVYDGMQIHQWMDFGDGTVQNGNPGFLEDLTSFIDPRILMLREQELATSTDGAVYTVTRNAQTIRLTVTAPAQGDYEQSDYALNSSITESDNCREYTFDADNGQLLGARVTVITDRGERPVLEMTKIVYDAPVDTAALTALPEGIAWNDLRRPLSGTRLAGIGAREAAELILRAMNGWDTEVLNEALRFFGPNGCELVRGIYEGVTPSEIGEPVRSGEYPGQFIPCKLLMRDGSVREIMLALRNDNAEGCWVVDGGI